MRSVPILFTNGYEYLNDRLSKITHNEFDYNFEYDSLGNNTKVLAGSQPLITNAYESRYGKLLESTYGNGQKIGFEYDDYDRVVATKYNSAVKYKYGYDNNGNLAFHDDLVNGINYRYFYDSIDRLLKAQLSNGNRFNYEYNAKGNVNQFLQRVNAAEHIFYVKLYIKSTLMPTQT